MADTFKGIITADGKKRQLPYENVLKTPISDETLSIQGGFADAKVVGDKFKEAKTGTDLLKEDLNSLIRVDIGNNILDSSKIKIGKWYQNIGGKAVLTSNEYTSDYGAAMVRVNGQDNITLSTDFTSLVIQSYFVTDSLNNIISSATPNERLPYTIDTSKGSKVFISLKNYNYISETQYIMCNYGSSALPYEEYTETEMLFNETADDYINNTVKSRKCMYISKDDSEIIIANKMLNAFNNGNVDVFFEKSVYTLKDCYAHLIASGMRSTAVGLPVGNRCRYYFNGSTIISNEPDDGFNTYRNVLDNNWCGSDFEVYDCTLINNGGLYCIHDEGASSDKPYTHKYVNVKMYTKNSEVSGSKPFGCGTGFDVNISFDGCMFVRDNETDVCIAIHGATTNPDNLPSKLDLIMKNCYVNVHNIALNLFETPRDTLDFFLFGNKFKTAFSNANVNLIENNNTTIS